MTVRRALLALVCAAAAAPGAASAALPSSGFNDTMGNYSECIPIRDDSVAVESWAFDGTDTGYRFNGIAFSGGDPCVAGKVRVQQYPPITAGGKTMYFQRGHGGRTDQEPDAIRHGHIHVSDLQYRPQEIPMGDPRVYPNGRPCPETATIYLNDPQGLASKGPIPNDLWSEPSGGSEWDHYGDPPQTQGNVHLGHYNYLVWNWLWYPGSGGGQVEAILNKNETIRRCDVDAIQSPMYRAGARVGDIRAFYGKVSNSSGSVVYGWVVHSWRANGYNAGAWSYLVSATRVP